ncbi:MAG: radical SAM protein [Polyangiaceae bacterium]|jgi:radical SAM superfamily enzyme YgiQ (UPF0313 family)
MSLNVRGSLDVVLVGRELAGDENLGVRYVASALLAAGHRPHIEALNGIEDVARVTDRILSMATPLVGLAISDALSAIGQFTLAHHLRERGFRGHITGGGALATLARHDILRHHPAIDSIVRHAGEVPMVELAGRIASGLEWHDCPGVTTSAGDGPPCAPSSEPFAVRPLRSDNLQRVLGSRVAQLISSRGCTGGCKYCGSHALRRMHLDEGLRAGLPRAELDRIGVGGRRRRSPHDVADEVSDLYHERGVRILHLLDDNVVGGPHSDGREWADRLADELECRGVTHTAWSLMIDPPSVTDPLLDALDRLGVARMVIGVESLTDSGLRSLGRSVDVEANFDALARARRRGIATLFNILAVHPTATGASIGAELDALEDVPSGVYYEVIPLVVYPGTAAYEELRLEGRVTGNDLIADYTPADPVAAAFYAHLTRLMLATGGPSDIALYAHHVSSSVAVARRLDLRTVSAAMENEMAELLDAVNATRLAAYRSLLALSDTRLGRTDDTRALAAIIQRLRSRLARVESRVKALHHRLEPTLIAGTERHHLLSARAVRGLVVMSLGAATACGGQTRVEGPAEDGRAPADASGTLVMDSGAQVTDSGATPATDTGPSSATDGSTMTTTDGSTMTTTDGSTMTTTDGSTMTTTDGSMPSNADGSDGAMIVRTLWTCVPPSEVSDSGTSDSDAGDYVCTEGNGVFALSPNPPSACTASDLGKLVGGAWEAAQQSCIPPEFASTIIIVVDAQGHVVGYQPPFSSDAGSCVVAALANETFPCLEGDTITYTMPTPLR